MGQNCINGASFPLIIHRKIFLQTLAFDDTEVMKSLKKVTTFSRDKSMFLLAFS